MTRLRTAVIGCGAISQEHFRYLSSSPLVDLAAVCDTSPAAGRYAAERFGAKAAFTDVAEMLAASRPDVVHVLTPPASHRPLVVQSLQAGAHVLCEKPIAFTAAELEVIRDAARTAGRRIVESHNYRFNDQILALDELIRLGRVGQVRGVDVVMSVPMPEGDLGAPAGAIHDYITHASYLALHFLGDAAVDVVRARWARTGANPKVRFDDLVAIVGCGPASATIRIAGDPRPMAFRVTVRGTAGQAETDLFQPYVRADLERSDGQLGPLVNHAANGFGLLASTARNLVNKVMQKGAYHGLDRMLAGCYEALAADREPPVTDAQIVRSVALIDAIVAEQATSEVPA